MKRLSVLVNRLNDPRIFLLIIFLAQLSIWSYVTFRPFRIQPHDATYALPREQTSYISYIRQAKDGSWCIMDNRTTRNTPCVYAYLYFVFLGKAAALFHLDPVVMYVIAQIAGGMAFFAAVYLFTSFLLPKKFRSYALFFIFLIQLGPLISEIKLEGFLLPPYSTIPLESSQLTIFRQFGLPNHTLGEALGILVLTIILYAYTKRIDVKNSLAIVIGTVIGVNVLAPYFLTIVLVIFPALLLYSIFTGTLKKLLLPTGLFLVAFTLTSLLLRSQLSLGPPWSTVYQLEKTWWTIPDLLTKYITSLYLYLPFILLAFITIGFMWKNLTASMRLAIFITVGWLCIPIIIMPVTSLSFFPVAAFRLIDGYQYVPAGILAAVGIIGVRILIRPRAIKLLLTAILIGSVSWVSFSLTNKYISDALNEQKNMWRNVYPPNSFWQAVEFFHTVPRGSRVLSAQRNGELLADYAPLRTFLGNTPGFPDLIERRGLMGWFMEGTRTDQVASDILRIEHIDYVFFGPDERAISFTDNLYPNELTPVFTRPGVIVYQVKKQ